MKKIVKKCMILLIVSIMFITAVPVTAQAASKNSSINMNIFKKKNVQKLFESMSWQARPGFKNQSELKKKLPNIVRWDFEYGSLYNRRRFEPYGDADILVPKNIVHKHIQDVYGIKVKSVKLPVKKGKYLLKELWCQDTHTPKYYRAVRTKAGATITVRVKDISGYYDGKVVFTVKSARNSRGFVITSTKYSRETRPTFVVSCSRTGSQKLTMKVKCSKGGKLTWKSSNKNVATVNNTGVITARKNGQATITASVKYNNKTYSVSRKLTVKSRKQYGSWSNWSLDPAYGNSYRQVRTTTLYRYYCFLCPVCGGREPLQGMSDCHQYRLTLDNGVVAWFTTPYSASNSAPYSYASYKRYTFSLGDGQRWNFSTGNINDHAVGTKDTDSPAVVIRTGYSTRSISTSYYISSVS